MLGLIQFDNSRRHPLRSVPRYVSAIPWKAVRFQLAIRSTVASHVGTPIPREPKLEALIALKKLSRHAIGRQKIKKSDNVKKIIIH